MDSTSLLHFRYARTARCSRRSTSMVTSSRPPSRWRRRSPSRSRRYACPERVADWWTTVTFTLTALRRRRRDVSGAVPVPAAGAFALGDRWSPHPLHRDRLPRAVRPTVFGSKRDCAATVWRSAPTPYGAALASLSSSAASPTAATSRAITIAGIHSTVMVLPAWAFAFLLAFVLATPPSTGPVAPTRRPAPRRAAHARRADATSSRSSASMS